MIVVTGKTGVGKTTILKRINKEVIHLDDVIKNVFYKRNFKLYWDIKEQFGSEFVGLRKVNTAKLGKLVFNEPNQLEKLNSVALPYIKTYLQVLKETNKEAIVEMAIYINNEKEFSKFFDKVVLIDRPQHLKDKFKYLDKEIQPIKKTKIKSDLIIKDKDLDKAVDKLNKYLNN